MTTCGDRCSHSSARTCRSPHGSIHCRNAEARDRRIIAMEQRSIKRGRGMIARKQRITARQTSDHRSGTRAHRVRTKGHRRGRTVPTADDVARARADDCFGREIDPRDARPRKHGSMSGEGSVRQRNRPLRLLPQSPPPGPSDEGRGGLGEAPVRRSRSGAPPSQALYPSDRHRQRAPTRLRERRGCGERAG